MTDVEERLRAAMESAVASEQPPRESGRAGPAPSPAACEAGQCGRGRIGCRRRRPHTGGHPGFSATSPGQPGGNGRPPRPSTPSSKPSSPARSSRSGRPPTGPASRSTSVARWRSRRTARPSTSPPAPGPSRSARPPISPAQRIHVAGYLTIAPNSKLAYRGRPF